MLPDAEELRDEVISSLVAQGYRVKGTAIRLPNDATKDDLRRINQTAVSFRVDQVQSRLKRHEDAFINDFADGCEINPDGVDPELICVKSGSRDELLFRYASLHWSIPVSSGYGRRIRFVIKDRYNGKLIGIFGIGDPVYSIKNRDNFIGWDKETKKEKLYHTMDAYVLGALPPYSSLLCGKLIALLTLSNEVRETFRQKYEDREAIISKKRREPWLVLLTTTSALGRSSIYNRIKVNGHRYWQSIGYTQGSGEFHFSNGIYKKMRSFVTANGKATAKHAAWGKGFRSKREVVKKCLPLIGLSTNLIYHGIKREIFVGPLANNSLEFLRGDSESPEFHDWSSEDLGALFNERWFRKRFVRETSLCDFRRDSIRVWPDL